MSPRSPFSRALLREQMRRRALDEHGDRGARTSPLRDDWRPNLHPSVLSVAERLVADGALPLHGHAHALNSSQAFAMNLFLPLVDGNTASFSAFAAARLGLPVTATGVELEFFGTGDLLAEIPASTPGPDDKLTAADVAVHLEDHAGRRGVLLIEVKLTEGGFTACGGVASRGNRDRGPCRNAAVFFAEPNRCYLRRPWRAKRDRRYWRIFEQEHGSVRGAFPGHQGQGPCPFAGDWQQPMRNHALALAMKQEGLVDFWHLALVHHDDNPDVPGPWEGYSQAVADRSSLHRWPASELLPFLGDATADPEGWVEWMRRRYVLEQEEAG